MKTFATIKSLSMASLFVASIICATIGTARGNQGVLVCGLISSVAMIVLVAGGLPGSIARSRCHPSAGAVTLLGWTGLLLTGGILWVVALAWACIGTPTRQN